MSVDSIAAPPLPLQATIPAYLYQQYADDETLQAFIYADNLLAQGYLNWMNATPLGVYTSPAISGPLLDWVGNGIYGIERPVFSTLSTTFVSDAVNFLPTNTIATDGSLTTESGTAITANDDYYKRTLTWCTYIGDGRVFNFPNLRKRVARFLYGVNGTDITLSQAQNVALSVGSNPNDVTITIPAGTASSYFSDALASGTLPFPFMLIPDVVIL
jgi:hypothetical protein